MSAGNLIKSYRDLKIIDKLSLLEGITVGGFLLIALIHVASTWAGWKERQELGGAARLGQLVAQLEGDALQASRLERAYLLQPDPELDRQLAKVTGGMNGELDELSRAGAPVADAHKALGDYQAAFEVAVGGITTIGGDGGTQAALAGAALKLEADLKAVRDPSLATSFAAMRAVEAGLHVQADDRLLTQMSDEQGRFQVLLRSPRLPTAQHDALAADMADYQRLLAALVAGNKGLSGALVEMDAAAGRLQSQLGGLQQWNAAALGDAATHASRRALLLNVLMWLGMAALALAVFMGVSLLEQSIRGSLGRLLGAIYDLSAGDTEARAHLQTKDELGELGLIFDTMMDERVSVQEKIERENRKLNDSVTKLVKAVAQLARRDLTVKVPVTDDVTGTVADALNLLTAETAKVLAEVSNISAAVTEASLKVKEQSDTVVTVAEAGRRQVDKTAEELADAAQAMNHIATLAQASSAAADNAIATAQSALHTVDATVGGINATRDTIRETEKRIKRLGERSQEISVAVNLINTIAERTHILALNASMHAASAGEAGRGFAVVAEEVQRLAENARQATAQIATLVNNIQVETADTVNTMNTVITQVVDGSRLAEQAGEQMRRTQATTVDLVKSVQTIATTSQAQAHVSNQLLQRAAEIRKATQHTSEQLKAQSEHTTNLVEYAKNLLGAVRVFKLQA